MRSRGAGCIVCSFTFEVDVDHVDTFEKIGLAVGDNLLPSVGQLGRVLGASDARVGTVVVRAEDEAVQLKAARTVPSAERARPLDQLVHVDESNGRLDVEEHAQRWLWLIHARWRELIELSVEPLDLLGCVRFGHEDARGRCGASSEQRAQVVKRQSAGDRVDSHGVL